MLRFFTIAKLNTFSNLTYSCYDHGVRLVPFCLAIGLISYICGSRYMINSIRTVEGAAHWPFPFLLLMFRNLASRKCLHLLCIIDKWRFCLLESTFICSMFLTVQDYVFLKILASVVSSWQLRNVSSRKNESVLSRNMCSRKYLHLLYLFVSSGYVFQKVLASALSI